MDFICFVKKENVSKAEEKLKSDFQIASRQSITVREAKSLGLKGEGSFFYITGSDEGVEKCKQLLKEFVEKNSKLEEAKSKINEEADAAAVGMGKIFG